MQWYHTEARGLGAGVMAMVLNESKALESHLDLLTLFTQMS